ncbi:hypothetical protein [Lacticaseibacillus thailandensis]|nr:hypothetical protein [Lacticaseibacillus thailandensis]
MADRKVVINGILATVSGGVTLLSGALGLAAGVLTIIRGMRGAGDRSAK